MTIFTVFPSSHQAPTTQPPRCSAPAQSTQSTHAVSSERLLRGQKAVAILHNGSLYKLQATKLGKLILTK